MGAQGIRVVVHPALGPGQGVEVAVGADALAEGYVEIKSGHVIQRYEKDG
jgi:hypothetical protein